MIDPARVREMERLLTRALRENDLLKSQVKELAQMMPRAWGGSGSGDGGGGSLCWARCPGVSAASGTWPSLTPSSFTADVYKNIGGTPTLAKESATVYWWYLDGADEGKLVPCQKNADGSYDAILDSCTEVPLDA